MNKSVLEGKIKKFLKKHYVEKRNTKIHFISRWIHRLAKLTALLPQPKLSIKQKPIHISPELKTFLDEKFKIYQKAIAKHQDNFGFIMSDHCDATLFSGLVAPYLPQKLYMTAAWDEDGLWRRRPVNEPCYPNGAASTFSRDMMTGLLWWFWTYKDVRYPSRTYAFLKDNSFVMGFGDPARLILMPPLEATLAEICFKLGGKNRWFARRQIQSWNTSTNGYGTHLQILHILLRGELMDRRISKKMFKILEHYAKQQPQNPLYQYAYHLYFDGNMDPAIERLLDVKIFPPYRLPKKKDRHSDWVNQRDAGKDWEPTWENNPEKEHSGGDFLHVAGMIKNKYER